MVVVDLTKLGHCYTTICSNTAASRTKRSKNRCINSLQVGKKTKPSKTQAGDTNQDDSLFHDLLLHRHNRKWRFSGPWCSQKRTFFLWTRPHGVSVALVSVLDEKHSTVESVPPPRYCAFRIWQRLMLLGLAFREASECRE